MPLDPSRVLACLGRGERTRCGGRDDDGKRLHGIIGSDGRRHREIGLVRAVRLHHQTEANSECDGVTGSGVGDGVAEAGRAGLQGLAQRGGAITYTGTPAGRIAGLALRPRTSARQPFPLQMQEICS